QARRTPTLCYDATPPLRHCPLHAVRAPVTAAPSRLSLHAALPISAAGRLARGGAQPADAGHHRRHGARRLRRARGNGALAVGPRSESTRLNSSHVKISYAVFCLKKKIYHYFHDASDSLMGSIRVIA